MKQIRKDYVLAMLVRTFFKFFTTAVAERAAQDGLADPLSARNIKQMMLNHYEQISKVYNQEAFYCLSRMNYEAETVEQHLRNFTLRNGSKPTDMDLIRFACRTEEFFQTMVESYKRHFMLLLEGRLATDEEFEESYIRNDAFGMMDLQQAESIINRMASGAYHEAKKLL